MRRSRMSHRLLVNNTADTHQLVLMLFNWAKWKSSVKSSLHTHTRRPPISWGVNECYFNIKLIMVHMPKDSNTHVFTHPALKWLLFPTAIPSYFHQWHKSRPRKTRHIKRSQIAAISGILSRPLIPSHSFQCCLSLLVSSCTLQSFTLTSQ